ncbi:MAG TPA: hypothetical protein VGT41_01590 [Candidatus Babeliales bacterium]|nr:hypothetical protein [Candidatus Babeliales bacterium]
MRLTTKSSGFILIFTLSIITISILLITYVSQRSSSHISFAQLCINRERASTLALSGVQLAMSQIAVAAQGTEKAAPTEVDHAKELLITLFGSYGEWQTFKLHEKQDGFDGEIGFCITSESGKIDINAIYDFDKKKFKGEGQPQGDYKKYIQMLFNIIQPKIKGAQLFEAFEKFLKERQYEVQDVTELLTLKEFAPFKQHLFYKPTEQPLFLTDIFTVWTKKMTLDPWLLSRSLRTVFNFQNVWAPEWKERENMKEKLKQFTVKTDWTAKTWNSMMTQFTNIPFENLPKEMGNIWDDTFNPEIFSVISYAKIGTMTQHVLAIVQRNTSLGKNDVSFEVTIKKLYWL